MKKKRYMKALLMGLAVFLWGFWYLSSMAIWGTSDDGVWKATYQKNFDQTVGGWIGHIKQTSMDKINIKEIRFTDNKTTLMSDKQFIEERMEDGL
ncbi:hypothetical protein [Fictibacillus barbaricus]|uniref:Uncharacterized protein n=1 Tax=Fictibacillus barbaricus TaxID=182136 RepID=A0ABU1TWG4_9BACL|nr:hypothetical protein [Fictibacillus barbaricus]MDR7071550.1 hypothetical protein [Fictibacillus barbaricus]